VLGSLADCAQLQAARSSLASSAILHPSLYSRGPRGRNTALLCVGGQPLCLLTAFERRDVSCKFTSASVSSSSPGSSSRAMAPVAAVLCSAVEPPRRS
jgi:hypothetical protein